MRALKVLVIAMGVAIVVGFAVVVVTVATRVGDQGGQPEGEAGFGRMAAGVPEGCAVAAMEPAGARVLLHLDGPAERGCAAIIVVDITSGRRLGIIDLTPGAEPATGGQDGTEGQP